MLHIDLPTRAEIAKLASHRGSPAVSLYLRTTPLTQDSKAERIELKNLLKSAVAEMAEAGIDKRSIWPIEERVGALIDDDDFWAYQANSLAIFATPERISTFRLANKLNTVTEVSDRFLLMPLIRALTFPHDAYVLAIGIGAARLVEVSADLPPHEAKVPGMPRDASAAIGRRSLVERPGDSQSGGGTTEHALLTRYSRAVDEALRPVLAGHERPLIIAAAEPLASIFRGVCSYPHLAEEIIAGSAGHTSEHELADAARAILDKIYAGEIAALADLYAARGAQGRATGDVAQAARAATFGAIDTLIVDMDVVLPGTVDEETGAVDFAQAADGVNYGVVDEIARRVIQSGAKVLAGRRADIPAGGDLAAILRYPI
ncbi:conserved hypothetical protein [Methylocella silvestris BL2]|uniref:Uncharacterized protein n=1 Tax=Methylocella silvestris (strain DSM 15510 / CIP 108128 / LMG 27833 / NCIMB 13906 / BL2) TaxID=395965 RepID=B8ENK7_METSB|nr:hypothetical protein [Methylocella silvestris]ACK50138.1 conserved hypothetical protein [Methylocella silvestris BL2]